MPLIKAIELKIVVTNICIPNCIAIFLVYNSIKLWLNFNPLKKEKLIWLIFIKHVLYLRSTFDRELLLIHI